MCLVFFVFRRVVERVEFACCDVYVCVVDVVIDDVCGDVVGELMLVHCVGCLF